MLVMCPHLCGIFWLRWAGWSALFSVAGPKCLPLARNLLPGVFVQSWCAVEGSVVGTVLDGVCPVVPVGRGWGSVARGPIAAVWWGRDAAGLLGMGLCVELVLCGCFASSAFQG
ncbi:hypothetical protein ATANTOWER_029082 [Ataeniobius toweri]|uniref:Secreted protein n=1 Tax=Ataeniobius toweri TaxID=208326 RepID=A0ABU7B614_9TELE|nr:hypothetical protein [Ataeniobius toweri]